MTFRFWPSMFKSVPVCFVPLNFHCINNLPHCLIISSTSKRDSVHSSLVSQSNTSPLNNTLHHVKNATNIFLNKVTLNCTFRHHSSFMSCLASKWHAHHHSHFSLKNVLKIHQIHPFYSWMTANGCFLCVFYIFPLFSMPKIIFFPWFA